MRSADGFLKRLAEHISGQTDPVAAVVERVAFAAETLAGDRQIQHLLTKRQQGGTIVSLTSDVALAFWAVNAPSIGYRLGAPWFRRCGSRRARGTESAHTAFDPHRSGTTSAGRNHAVPLRGPMVGTGDRLPSAGSGDGCFATNREAVHSRTTQRSSFGAGIPAIGRKAL